MKNIEQLKDLIKEHKGTKTLHITLETRLYDNLDLNISDEVFVQKMCTRFGIEIVQDELSKIITFRDLLILIENKQFTKIMTK